jgi:ribosomal protein S18 acetylase RimI-like enzyme
VENIVVRRASVEDAAGLLSLMKALARFERYFDAFAVTEEEVLRRGFSKEETPEFFALLAETNSTVVGYVVYYLVPFTFDLKPTMILKELYVVENFRNRGVATRLLDRLEAVAEEAGCGRIRWSVLPENQGAKWLYRRWGATQDDVWEHWLKELPVDPDQPPTPIVSRRR